MTRAIIIAGLLTLFAGGDALAQYGDPENFFQRLESIGLDTTYLRKVNKDVEIEFRKSNDVAEAEWGYIKNNLYIPPSFKEEGSNKLRFNLAVNEIDTLVHEYTHAAKDLDAEESPARGTPGHTHYRTWRHIRDQLWNDPDQKYYVGVFPATKLKADEVQGYYMGKAISELFQVTDEIVLYNTVLDGGKVETEDEARKLGGTLLLPPRDSKENDNWEKGFWNNNGAPFHRRGVKDSATFNGNLIQWKEGGQDDLKRRMYRGIDGNPGILGLKPPADVQELLQKLNTIDNEWIRGIRQKVAEARLKNARAAQEQKAQADKAKQPEAQGITEKIKEQVK